MAQIISEDSDPPNLSARPGSEPGLRRPGRWLAPAKAAWLVIALLCIGLYLASIPPLFTALQTPCAGAACLAWQLSPAQVRSLHDSGISLRFYAAYFTMLGVVVAATHAGIAAFIFWRKSADWLALLGSLTLLTFGVASMNDIATAALVAISPAWQLPVSFLIVLGDIGLLIFFCLFPDGRFTPRWTRWLALGWIIFRLLGIFVPLSPFERETGPLTRAIWLGFLGGVAMAQIYRYRNVSNPMQRQQTKWIVFSITVAIGGFLGIFLGLPLLSPALFFDFSSPYTWAAITAVNFFWLLVPLSIGVAILRYRLWDIDLIINRTLVYGMLTACVVGLYVLVVGGLGALFHTGGNLLISLVATAIVAVLFAPLRDRLQRGVNRLLYGQRDDPYAVLSALGQRLEATLAPDAVLPTIVAAVKEALKLPYVAIALDQEGRSVEVAAAGTLAPDPLCLPLRYQGETIGQLILASRTPGETFTPAERRLLADLAHQAGVAAAAVRLTADLQRSRERLVTAREEERRRLRRDLHDGLGPALAAQTLKIGSARILLQRDPVAADTLLDELETDIQTALVDIRRLVYNLRPPSLDELGLIGAIRETADRYSAAENGPERLQIIIEAPDSLPPLPAAVEVAVYRIVQEALTNVIRHAQARKCVVRLAIITTKDTRLLAANHQERENAGSQQPILSAVNKLAATRLELEIVDDGVGLSPDRQTGVGLASMRERAQELGGTCQIETGPDGGVQVLARLPLSKKEELIPR